MSFSERIYALCLRLYPARFRDRFGPEMRFHFQQEQLEAAGERKLLRFWARIGFDLACSLPRAHLVNLQESFANMKTLPMRPVSFTRLFVAISAVFLATVILTTLYILPRSYTNLARVEIVKESTGQPYDPYLMATAMERLKSRPVLESVVYDLGLQKQFGWQHDGAPMTEEEAYQHLLNSLDLRQLRNTALMEIRVQTPDNQFGAHIANTIAQTFAAMKHPSYQTLIIDPAVPSLRPARPNVPLNIALGTLISLMAAAAIALLCKSRLAFG